VSKELLEGVKAVEREKGIEEGTLLSAIEDALLAAYKKMPDARHAWTSTATAATTPCGR
jgi:N utilization substance protein A